MGWDGSGNVNRSDGTRSGSQVWQDAKTAGVKIRSDDHDTHDEDIADAIENTVAKDGQNTTTTDNAILRYDSGNSSFEGVTISASQVVGRGSSGDVKGINTASARALLGVGSAVPTNSQFLYWSSASSQYVQATAATARSLIGLGTASPSDNDILRYDTGNTAFEGVSISASQFVGRGSSGDVKGINTASARALLGLGSATPTNNQFIYWASASSQYVQATAATARSLIGLGTASPTNNAVLMYSSASSSYEETTATAANTANTIALRDGNARLKVADPSAAQDAATKAYVDGIAAGLVPLAQASASSDATIDFTSNIDSTYDTYVFHLTNVIPATDNQDFHMRTSTDAGNNWDSSASDYKWVTDVLESGSTRGSNQSDGDTEMVLYKAAGSAAGEAFSGVIVLHGPSNSNVTTSFQWDWAGKKANNVTSRQWGGGDRDASEDVDGVRFLFASGNIESGEFRLYGVKKS